MSINRYPHDWHDTFRLQSADLRNQFPDAHLYAMIDGVLNESCYSFVKRSTHLKHFALYKNTPSRDEETLGLSPLLIEYDAAEQRAWNKLMAKTDGLPALSLIVSPESLDQLAARLTPWCIVKAGGQFLALSFSDTRILPELCKALTAEQLGQFFGPALRWQYVARNAEWRALPLPEIALPPADEVTLDEQQCARLIAASEADGVLFQLRRRDAALVDCQTPARAHEFVCHWLACADHAHIDALPERVELCELGLMHPALERDPQVVAWLNAPGTPTTLDALKARWIK